MCLSIQRCLIGDVHRNVHRIRAIETGIGKRHCQSVADLERDPFVESEHAGQLACNLAELWGQIDSGYSASKVIREVARGPADSASNVQQMVSRIGFN